LTVLEETRQPFEDVKAAAAPVIEMITVPLKALLQDHVPVVHVLEECLPDSAANGRQSAVKEDQFASAFIDNHPSEPDISVAASILLTAKTAPIGSTVISCESSIQIDLEPATSVEDGQQSAPILMKGEDTSDPFKSVAVEEADTSDLKLVCSVRDVEQPATAILEPIVREEDEIASLPEDQDSNPASIDSIVFEGVDKLPILTQLLQELPTGDDGELDNVAQSLILPYTDTVHSSDSEKEEKEQVFGLESIINLKPLNVELVFKYPTPVQPVGASTSVVEEGKVSDPADASPVLLTPLHFAAPVTELLEEVGRASPVTEEGGKMELIVKEERTISIESHFEMDSKMLDESFSSLNFPTPERRFVYFV